MSVKFILNTDIPLSNGTRAILSYESDKKEELEEAVIRISKLASNSATPHDGEPIKDYASGLVIGYREKDKITYKDSSNPFDDIPGAAISPTPNPLADLLRAQVVHGANTNEAVVAQANANVDIRATELLQILGKELGCPKGAHIPTWITDTIQNLRQEVAAKTAMMYGQPTDRATQAVEQIYEQQQENDNALHLKCYYELTADIAKLARELGWNGWSPSAPWLYLKTRFAKKSPLIDG